MTPVSDKRRSEILETLSLSRTVKVAELSSSLGVSEVSIRRDLQRLEELGLLKRVHGGAVPVAPELYGSAISGRFQQNHEKKERIGRAAAELVCPEDRLFLDSGSTTVHVARSICAKLPNPGNLTIITNSLPIVREAGPCPGVHLILLGGIYLPSFEIVVGPQTIEQLKGLHADKIFVGTDGITLSQGLTTANVLEAEVDRAMVNAATEVIVVSDSSKIGLIGLVTIMPLPKIHKLITDCEASPDFVASLRDLGIEVILV